MKHIVEILLTYEVDAPDMRQAQIIAYKRAIDLCDSEIGKPARFSFISPKRMKCVSSMVRDVTVVNEETDND